MTTFIGIDGCRSGWVVVSLNDQTEKLTVEVKQQLIPELFNSELAQGSLALIDIPIGLPGGRIVERSCDRIARSLLKFRKASLFPAPQRAILTIESYAEANLVQRRLSGKGLSKQTWNLVQKIREIDLLFQSRKTVPTVLRESHPELCFELLYRSAEYHLPLQNKRTPQGRKQRLLLLKHLLPAQYFYHLERLLENPRVGYQPDDLFDATVLALTSELISKCCPSKTISCGTDEVDETGLPMRIFHPPQPAKEEDAETWS